MKDFESRYTELQTEYEISRSLATSVDARVAADYNLTVHE